MRTPLFALAAAVALAAPAPAASVGDLQIHSTSVGAGPVIVFVHGWTCDESSWDGQVDAFASDYRVITLDLPGHGQSDAPADDAFSIDLFADAVEAVRAEAGAERIVLVGHSMGGPVLRQYAIHHPEHVAGLVAVDGPLVLSGGGPPLPQGSLTLELRETIIRSMFVEDTSEALQEHILSMMLGAPEATANGAMAAMFNPALREEHVIAAPTLLVVAGTGQLPDVGAMAAVLPDAEATQLAGTGHFLMMEKPDEFNALLTAFLDVRAEY
jgi:pimeloyl-ACP methyl ester carboxylesterase